MNIARSVARPALACCGAALALAACSAAEPPLPPLVPQLSGSVAVEGLADSVTVIRDKWGIPHIEASSSDDLFTAQGFVQAQDRLFQMDLWRRSVQGRLAEVLGSNFVERDAMTRRMQYRGDLDAEWSSYGPDARAAATAFVRGVNAWVTLARARRPEEFVLAGWGPELWAPEDLLNRTDAFLASAPTAQDEVFRTQLVAALGPRLADAVLPPGAGGTTVLPRELDAAAISAVAAAALRRVGTPPFFMGLAAPLPVVPAAGDSSSAAASNGGSNAWAMRSASGSRDVRSASENSDAALLATDPHRPLVNPSLRYLVHLKAPGWHVIGATAPWLPGVAIGHNDHIAWSATSRPQDTQDLFLERTNPANPRQVWDEGRWVEMVPHRQVIGVKGSAKPFEYDELRTPRGVVIAVDGERHLAYVLRWIGTEPGTAAELGALAIDRAQSWQEFQAAAARWKAPSVELVYADAGGHVASQAAGLAPVRSGVSGAVPRPAWTGSHDWTGWLAAERLPSTFDPRSGTVVSANGHRSRERRIAEGLRSLQATSAVSVDGFRALQHDAFVPDADALVTLLRALTAERPDVDAARVELVEWDRRMIPARPAASLYAAWERHLIRQLAALRIPRPLVAEYVPRARDVLVGALTKPSRVWFDGNVTHARDSLLLSALAAAVDERTPAVRPSGRSGSTAPTLNQILFAHPLGISDAARGRFNRGPYAVPGHANAILSIAGTASERMVGPSFRAIFDTGDWDRSVATQAPGQSGSPSSPHFSDLVEGWTRAEYFPLAFTEEAVKANAVSLLTLRPKGGN